MARWGPPARSDGPNSHTWVSEGAPAYYGGGPSVGVGVFGGGGHGGVGVGVGFPIGQPAPVPVSRCERTLVFQDSRVVEQNWVGPADYCSGFRRS